MASAQMVAEFAMLLLTGKKSEDTARSGVLGLVFFTSRCRNHNFLALGRLATPLLTSFAPSYNLKSAPVRAKFWEAGRRHRDPVLADLLSGSHSSPRPPLKHAG